MNATNNPYAVTPPDKTLTQEGVPADAKASHRLTQKGVAV